MRRWRRLRCYVDTIKGFCLLLLALILRGWEGCKRRACCVAIGSGVVLLWMIYASHDPCRGRQITANVCNDYKRGEISGTLCPSLCRERSISLTVCVENAKQKSFWWDTMMIRVPASTLAGQGHEVTLVEGMRPSQFLAMLSDFLHAQLGPSDVSTLMKTLQKFADFNEDGKLSLGEAQSLWRLVQQREFLVLFIFQRSYSFPPLNGTCGSVFAFTHPQAMSLYNKDIFPLHLLSSTAYRWFLPKWEQRAKVALGILDLVFDLYEEEQVRFYLCDVTPGAVGYTSAHEAVLTDTQHVYSTAMLASLMENQTCRYDYQCHFSNLCTTVCGTEGRCSGAVTKPTLWQACLLLQEYLLHDAPFRLKGSLDRLLQRCSHLIVYGQSIDLSHVVLVTDLKAVLWDHIKNMDVQ